MSSNQSLVSMFDEITRLNSLAASETYLSDFLRFASHQEECRIKWLDAEMENKRLKRLLDESKKENIDLERNLSKARVLLDQERKRKVQCEEERLKAERQLQTVRDCLLNDNRNQINDETKQKLKFLNATARSRISNEYDHLSAIQDVSESLLSDLSYSRSDDDLDAIVQKKRTYKKLRPSLGSDEPYSVKRRRSHLVELNRKDGSTGDRLVATTKVTVEHDGAMSAQSQIETYPVLADYLPSAPLRQGSMESVESDLLLEHNDDVPQDLPRDVGVLPISSTRIPQSKHMFVPKTIIRPEECDVCEKRIKFGTTALRCNKCRATSHSQCKENLPLPCIELGNTPINKKNVGVLADYAPTFPPMVPSIVQHCVKEIEARGLNEHGIYRIPGSDKDVRALKEKFMKGRGVPRLYPLDIHVICGCLKDFLRSLKEPLVTHSLWWQFANAADTKDVDERKERLIQAVSELPQPNRETLAFIILHLLKIAESKEMNKMTISNLSTVLGVTMVGYPAMYNTKDTYILTLKSTTVLEQLLCISAEYWSLILNTGSAHPAQESTPCSSTTRTPKSTRSLKKLFETPRHV